MIAQVEAALASVISEHADVDLRSKIGLFMADHPGVLARAAIEAMREPTIEMIDAACVAQIDLYPAFEGQKPQPTAGEVIGTCHRAMIDAALGK